MKGELVTVLTTDRVRLDGMLFLAEDNPSVNDAASHGNAPFDAAVISHGLGGNFYGARLLKYLARALLNRGISCVLANNRGHDLVNWTSRSAQMGNLGAAYENVGECVYDIDAWAKFLSGQGFERILLAGHSLGAIKTLYSAAYQKPATAQAVLGLSATRLNYDRLIKSSGREKFQRMIDTAHDMLESDRGKDLMKVDFPFATWMTAAAYLEKYGPASRYDWFGFAERVDLPALLLFGELELKKKAAFSGMEDDLKELTAVQPNFHSGIIEGADHYYSLRYDAMWNAVERWLNQFSQ